MALGSTILVRCKNPDCARQAPIRLPDPTLTGKIGGQSGTPISLFHIFVACPDCARISAYRTGDCEWDRTARDRLPEDLVGKALLSAHRTCGYKNCGAHITVLTVIPRGLTNEDIASLIGKWRFLASYGCEGLETEAHLLKDSPGSYHATVLDYSELPLR